ncbi:MAG: elongation factor 4 [Gemmatimonadetes bacterium]|uniref:Elongation factor 4 n=1 Tax=Candidatus Kutchimonas denitrificans TaxID=3056748 RepID=A0AAE5CCA3_9BACT|nr:elongation factor 4 [Gemmatimonadota bacterium]NIR75573.1 elongation factor 4 [Candidatus Kutchimonas denitrificans]NIS01887.1 elongation factor 4 [Gemmatimonadota bacterium]NIT67668.1 elongation factor 4 [Gemmatimonadota bacterium]NIU53542.1 elongation factor 4 [Gemmatimonadota bacterium]
MDPKAEGGDTRLNTARIRNFCIVAHIDHGKSTLADRLLERTGAVDPRLMKEQVLDSMDLERERGITIKAHAIRFGYEAADGETYELNLIDTPGHVDFTYEVSRSLAACEGAILVVDASQGIEAQTLSNLFLALEADLTVVPVINKIDLPAAEPERRRGELAELLGCEEEEILLVSAKQGTNVEAVLEAVVSRVPPPSGDPEAPLRALIFDSQHDNYQGAVPLVRVVDGAVREGMEIAFGSNDSVYEVREVGYLRLGAVATRELSAGEVGYLAAGIKSIADTKVGDTVLDANDRAEKLLPGYREVKPMVFAGLYPGDTGEYERLRGALEKLKLNDASIHYEFETSEALGFGFRCGFLGLLHMEIVRERLEREFDLELVSTVPNVEYRVHCKDGAQVEVENPSKMPDAGKIAGVEEPYVRLRLLLPAEYIGGVQKLCQDRRGEFGQLVYIDGQRVEMTYDLPLAEMVLDFYEKLKSLTRGTGGLDYDLLGFRESDMVKLDVMLNGEPVDALSMIVHRDKAYRYGRSLVERLREMIPRQLYEVAIQAAVGSRVIARETVRPLRKNVTAKCYGGDVTRKRKLLEKQKEGKQRMKQVGQVEVPREAFLAMLEVGRE